MGTMTMALREAQEEARRIDETLRADDPRFANTVHLIMDDGSAFLWDSAFCLTKELSYNGRTTKWLMVFTEHYGFHVFDEEECLGIRMWGPRLPYT